MRSAVSLTLFIAAVSVVPAHAQRIAGGSYTTIDQYPSMGAISYAVDWINYVHQCGSAILNNRALLTAAHCFIAGDIERVRVRLGSSYISSGGTTFTLSQIIFHPGWGTGILDSDIAIIHTNTLITYTNLIQPGSFAGVNYIVPDNSAVWAAGWGSTGDEPRSEQLKHVQLWRVNHDTCRSIYPTIINERMICALSNTEGNGQCGGDSGSPLFHGNVVVGVLSFGAGACGSATFPSVSTSVSNYITWILSNA